MAPALSAAVSMPPLGVIGVKRETNSIAAGIGRRAPSLTLQV
jgi:hypothetical protein